MELWHTNWYILAYAILAPEFCCPEKAYYEYFAIGEENRKIRAAEWMPKGMLDEMCRQQEEIGNKRAADLYGIHYNTFWHMLKKYRRRKNNG